MYHVREAETNALEVKTPTDITTALIKLNSFIFKLWKLSVRKMNIWWLVCLV